MTDVRETGTLVIGASAAGLAAAACLKDAGVDYEVLERETAVATAWRHHYDRLHLHTPKAASSLPGLPMPRHWPRYPSREQVVQYLELYAGHHGIEPHFGTDVTSLVREHGAWTASTTNGTWRAQNVVVATGATRKPVRPTWTAWTPTPATSCTRASTATASGGAPAPSSSWGSATPPASRRSTSSSTGS